MMIVVVAVDLETALVEGSETGIDRVDIPLSR
jgi:hypothetical protein